MLLKIVCPRRRSLCPSASTSIFRRQRRGRANEVFGDRPRFLPRAAKFFVAGIILQHEKVRHLRARRNALGAQIHVLMYSGESLAVTSKIRADLAIFCGDAVHLVTVHASELREQLSPLQNRRRLSLMSYTSA